MVLPPTTLVVYDLGCAEDDGKFGGADAKASLDKECVERSCKLVDVSLSEAGLAKAHASSEEKSVVATYRIKAILDGVKWCQLTS